jgi:Sulfotransferase family
MSIFKNRIGLKLAQRTKAFLKETLPNRGVGMIQAHRNLVRQEQEIAALRAILAERDAGGQDGGIRPENIIWIFGSGRTGSSWTASTIGSLPNHSFWDEPMIGYLFGHPYYELAEFRKDTKHFILGNDYREIWLSSLRTLVLDGATARFPERAEKGYLVIKEPHGSIGAPLLTEALPESRIIFLVRDPRDVVASALSLSRVPIPKRGSRWEKRVNRAEEQPDAFVKARARTYLRDINLSTQAYEGHKGRKVLVRYEDLRANTLGTMRRIYSTLEIPVDEGKLTWAVEKHSWENIPKDEKGPGTGRRKATPGGWREDLTPKQVEIVEKETADILNQFYAGVDT